MDSAEEELSSVPLNDARLDKHVCKLLSSLSHPPQARISRACGDAASIKAAYHQGALRSRSAS